MIKNYIPSLLIITYFVFGIAKAQYLEETQKIFASDGFQYQKFGSALSMSDTYLIVGAPAQSNLVGSCYVFKKNAGSWIQLSKLEPSPETGTSFGCAVGLEGNQIFVGENRKDAPNGDDDTGAAYVFTPNNGTWEYETLIPDDLLPGYKFGSSISVDKDYLVIGAINEYYNGSVYLYKNSNGTWEQVQKITNNLSRAQFGFSSAIIDGFVLIGAPYEATVYLYRIDNDQLVDPIELSYGTRGILFGYDVDLTTDFLFVSAPLSDENGNDSGSVYVYSKLDGFWVLTQILIPNDSGNEDTFGATVHVSGNYLYVGANGQTTDEAVESGSVYIFYNNNGNWEEIGKIIASDAFYNMRYGSAIASNSHEISVGAMHRATGITEFTGAAYVYSTSTLSIDEQLLTQGLHIYPNPVNGKVYLKSEVPLKKVEIYSILGQKIKEVHNDFQAISTNDMSRGIYLIKISSERGYTVRKLVKE